MTTVIISANPQRTPNEIKTRVRFTRPESRTFDIQGLLPEHAWVRDREWVRVEDVMATLRCIVFENKTAFSELSLPSHFFKRFGLLGGRKDAEPRYTWLALDTYDVDTALPPQDQDRYSLSILKEFSDTVLALAEKGIVYVYMGDAGTGVDYEVLMARDYAGGSRPVLKLPDGAGYTV